MPLTPHEANDRERILLASAQAEGQVWALRRDGGYANFTDEGSTVIPIWANEGEAKVCSEASFPGYQPCAIALTELMEEVLPQLVQRGAWVVIHPTADLCGNQVPAHQLMVILGQEGAEALGD
jgi:Protein of unknown function (DUF2750)